MVNVTDCAHVYVWLITFKLSLSHEIILVYVEHGSKQLSFDNRLKKTRHLILKKQTNKPAFGKLCE